MSVIQVRPGQLCLRCQPLGIEDPGFSGSIRFRFVEMNDLCSYCAHNPLVPSRRVDYIREKDTVSQVEARSPWYKDQKSLFAAKPEPERLEIECPNAS